MILADVMDEVSTVLAQVTGLRVQAYPASTITPPAGVVNYPVAPGIRYHQTYGRGETSYPDVEVTLVTSRVTDRSARDQASAWCSDTGDQSVVDRLEAHTWTSCDDVTVVAAEFETVTIGGTDYLGVIFHLSITGPGNT
ncbi:hypothetical protein [Actinoplanes lobatus]|uniref:Uncharacterized protein n=1 Tax=Actinoplanes lobatus TaxID=113568 RepID=A0A7W7HRD1_9ACTN|nr:hypothetical protein [Actinoplanes lobatus]MBB4755301.1 hypothetical protein [Actinoplanes lobatus]GIE46203.1 hypothetical protein Alo02nite_91010 [Actinoplanes lobatus]